MPHIRGSDIVRPGFSDLHMDRPLFSPVAALPRAPPFSSQLMMNKRSQVVAQAMCHACWIIKYILGHKTF